MPVLPLGVLSTPQSGMPAQLMMWPVGSLYIKGLL
jgi:hypothetical protein